MRGRFCVIEGIDGSGKSTLVAALRETLSGAELARRSRGRWEELVVLREPTGGPTGRRIRELLAPGSQRPDTREWLDLFLQDRAENVRENIAPALARGALVIQDRYYFSTAAYQGLSQPQAPGFDPAATPQQIVAQNRDRGFPAPDVLLYLEIDPALALGRIQSARAHLEQFETLAELRRIHAAYAGVLPATASRLDATRPTSELVTQALTVLLAEP